MKERDFQKWVTDVATRTGWRWWHVPAAMRAVGVGGNVGFVGAREAAGLPDLILMHDDPPRLVFAELKGKTGWHVTPAQREFLQRVKAITDTMWYAGETVLVAGYVWRPGMEGEIETLLKSRVLT